MASKFSDIILALVAKVAEVITDENGIIVTARQEDLPALVGDRDVLLRIRSFRDTEGTTAAAGRHAMWIRRYIDIIIRARQFSDVSKQDLQWLVDETNGILDLELQLIDKLELWHPVAGLVDGPQPTPIIGNNPQFLLVEPARITGGEDPGRMSFRGRGSPIDPNIGVLTLKLDLLYEEVLNQAIQ